MIDNSSSTKKNSESHLLAERVLTKISREHMTPRPRWRYVFRNRALWIAAVLALGIAALSSAAILFILANAGWRYAPATHGNTFALLLAVLPSVWLVALILFIVAGYWNIRHTARGYRYPLPLVVAMVVLFSVLSGAVLFTAGFGQEVEEGIGAYVPFYHPFLGQERSWWLDTSHGLLMGRIVTLSPDFSSFTLQTSSGVLWHINTSDLRSADITILARGGTVRVVGVPRAATSTTPFHACFVFPWEIRGSFFTPPIPLVALPPPSEIISRGERSKLCKGVRPYKPLRALEQGE